MVESNISWISISLWGYRDLPITWKGKEHGFLFNGEHDQTIILKQNGESLSFKQYSAKAQMK